MKILHVTKKYPNAIGGDAFVVANLEKQQKLSGNEVFILTSNSDEVKNNKNISKFGFKDTTASLDKITFKRLLSLMILFFISFNYLRKIRPSIIHTHSIDMAFFISFAAHFYGIPIVHTFHALTFNDPQQILLKRKSELFFLRGVNPKKVIVLNPSDIKDFQKKGFNNVLFVPNGIDMEEWSKLKVHKKNNKFTFIAVGRLEEQKGFSYLIEAAKKLNEKGAIFQIQIVGKGSQYQHLNDHIKKYNLENNIFLLGRHSQKELRILYSQADAFVLPSLWEEFPLTLLEAWVSKLPVIISKVGAIPAISKNKVNALIIEPKTPKKLAYAMDILIKNKQLADMLSKNGYDEVIKNFNWKNINQTFIKVYEQ